MRKPELFKALMIGLVCIVISTSQISASIAPQALNEPPLLRERVARGELPPVAERLPVPEDLYVVTPNERVGVYGGTARVAAPSPEGGGNDNLFSTIMAAVLPTPDLSAVFPNIVKNLDSSEDTRVWTMQLREGMRWSDGVPFTADDVMFWYEDSLLNEDLTPHIGVPWRIGNEVVEVRKIDDFTVAFEFPSPSPFFASSLTQAHNIFMPKHYLQQFHIDYAQEDDLRTEIEKHGYDTWYELFMHKNSWVWSLPLNEDLPTLAAYVLVDKDSTKRVYERNPYFWKVDTAGNQLPYIDRIEAEIVSDREVVQGKIMSGELTLEGLTTDLRNYPLYRSYEEIGQFRTLLWDSGNNTDVLYMVNMTHRDPVLRQIFQDVRFRRALSLAINRDEINDVIYFGQAVPIQATILESPFFEPEFATAHIEYDPDEANRLLDEMGLDARDPEGYRLRPDGERLLFTVEYFDLETPKTPNVELVSQHWHEVGIDARYRSISGELQAQRAPANMMDATLWHGGGFSALRWPFNPKYTVPSRTLWASSVWPEWGRWHATGGQSGEEPPPEMKQLYNWWQEMLVEPDEDRRNELGKNIFRAQAENLWMIGTVGKTPAPVIVSNDLRNFPEHGYWVWDGLFTMSLDPEQFFFQSLEE